MEKQCQECGEKLIGRSDKKFCGDACRSAHHNTQNRDRRKLMRTTNRNLRKNYQILETLNPKGKTKIHKNILLQAGYQFAYVTGLYHTQNGSTYFYVYDQGYLPLGNEYYLLVKKD